MSNSILDQCFYVGDVYIDPLNNTFKKDGELITVPPKAVLILQCLALNKDRMVSFNEITDFAWGRTVSHAALYQQLAVLRKLLGDSTDHPTFIKTISRKGYRLLVSASFASREEASSPSVHESLAGPGNDNDESRQQDLVISLVYGFVVTAFCVCLVYISYRSILMPLLNLDGV